MGLPGDGTAMKREEEQKHESEELPWKSYCGG
jgi:hypothetical protein